MQPAPFPEACKCLNETVSIGRAGGDGRLDLDPNVGTFYCRVRASLATSQFKSNVSIRNMAQSVKSHAKRHAQSVAHKQAVSKCKGADAAGCGTPPAEHFNDVWDAACKGGRAGNGLPQTWKRGSTDKLIWCIHEAIRREGQDIVAAPR